MEKVEPEGREKEMQKVESEINIKSLGAYLTEDRKFIGYLLGKEKEKPVSLSDAIQSVRLAESLLKQTR